MILKMAVFNKVDCNEIEPAVNSMAMMRVTSLVLEWTERGESRTTLPIQRYLTPSS